jgi:hypothetical protein
MVDLQSEGLDLIARTFTLILLLATFLQLPGAAEEGDIIVNMFVNYGAAYRDGSWVPVDVIVANDDFDISGWVEVRTFSGSDTPQSPIYRVPAECPKGSRKRFRLHCCLEQATRIEAMLYHRNRPALEIPAWMGITPIDPKDLLGLVLDEEPSDFGFLFRVASSEDRTRRFHREALRNAELSFLADHPQCYESLDMIIMGDIEPNRISLHHRGLLRNYVEDGGVLVVCTGIKGVKYRGTWVEELMGVNIGSEEVMNGIELARSVFPETEQSGAKAGRECILSRLVPASPQVKTFGTNKVLATLNPVGRGFVATIGVDASSHALQDCVGYLNLWRELCSMRYRGDKLNLSFASQLCANSLPVLTGVRIQPKSSVLTYLLLYFGVAIVANWIVCSLLKRRELAWVLLIVFSVGFTAYAMVFGTAGRAKSSELEQIEVLHVRQGENTAELKSIVGILTARTSRYSIDLTREFALAKDVWTAYLPSMYGYRGQRGSAGGIRPFRLIQDSPPRVENLTVGASEMRLMQVETEVPVDGGVDGRLVLDENGLNGLLKNNTGFRIRDPFILLNGGMYPVRSTPGGWDVAIPLTGIDRAVPRDPRRGGMPGFMYYPEGGPERFSRFRTDFVHQLFSAVETPGAPDPDLGPFLCGWTAGPCVGSVAMDVSINKGIAETLLVADIEVDEQPTGRPAWSYLRVRIDSGPWMRLTPTIIGADVNRYAHNLYGRNRAQVAIEIPRWFVEKGDGNLFVDLYWYSEQGRALAFVPGRASPEWVDKHAVEKQVSDQIGGVGVSRTTYKVDDWRSYYNTQSGRISGTVSDSRYSQSQGRPFSDYFGVIARVDEPEQIAETGGQSRWR